MSAVLPKRTSSPRGETSQKESGNLYTTIPPTFFFCQYVNTRNGFCKMYEHIKAYDVP